MKKILNNLKQEASAFRMSAAEKAFMRAQLFGATSPVQIKQSPYFFFSYQFRMVMAGLLVFVLAGAGTASAAQGALPGDILYPVKINVTEPVEVALAQTSAAKVDVQAKLATRRVEEAQELASQGRLDVKTAETLTNDFDEHSAQALALEGPEDQASADASAQTMATFSAAQPKSGEATTAEATTTPEQGKSSNKKFEGRRGLLQESLRANGEILRELRAHASSTDSKDGSDQSPSGDNVLKLEIHSSDGGDN
jgi:hypothetical protein